MCGVGSEALITVHLRKTGRWQVGFKNKMMGSGTAKALAQKANASWEGAAALSKPVEPAFRIALWAVLQQVHPDTGITNEALLVVDDMIHATFQGIAAVIERQQTGRLADVAAKRDEGGDDEGQERKVVARRGESLLVVDEGRGMGWEMISDVKRAGAEVPAGVSDGPSFDSSLATKSDEDGHECEDVVDADRERAGCERDG